MVRYWLHGFNWSLIAPRGPTIAANWHSIEPTFGAHRAEEALRNYIPASRHDPDYRGGAGWHRGEVSRTGRPFPAPLAAWAIQCHRGELPTPPKPRGAQGRPAYAQANRNFAMAEVFHLLGYLGLHRQNVRCSVISKSSRAMRPPWRNAPRDPCPVEWQVSPPVGMLVAAQAQRPVPSLAASGLDTIHAIVSIDLRRSRGTMRST